MLVSTCIDGRYVEIPETTFFDRGEIERRRCRPRARQRDAEDCNRSPVVISSRPIQFLQNHSTGFPENLSAVRRQAFLDRYHLSGNAPDVFSPPCRWKLHEGR
jgi:hypothetical protein